MFDINEIKKDLYKSKAIASFSHYTSGNLYYVVSVMDGKYQFPISTVDNVGEHTYITNGKETYNLSSDLGTTDFLNEMKGSELIRWIQKAIKSETFIKIS